jgi:hypothetical protein
MKTTIRQYCQQIGIAGLALFASIGTGMAQNVVVDQFNNATAAAEVAAWANNPGWGIAAGAPTFFATDAQGSAASGSITFQWTYTNSSTPAGVQFNTSAPAVADLGRATFIEFDLMVDPASGVDNNGNICAFQGGANGVQCFGFNLGPWGTAYTVGVWQHFKLPITPGTYTGPGGTFFINPWGGNGWGAITTYPTTMIIHVDNIVIDIPVPGVPTYPSTMALTFDNATNVVTTGTTGWYGNPINTYEWSSQDASNNPNSGSLHVVADFTANNNSCVCAVPFDPLYPGFSSPTPDTNVVINAQHCSGIEMDIKWDTANSTVAISDFNSVGDITGFPVGLLYNAPGGGSGGQAEAFGATTTSLPDAASNGWVHVSFPIDPATANIDQTIGLWFKKYQWNSALSGTVAFYIDNVNFIGGPIPQVGPPLAISKPVYGLQQAHSTGGYQREGVVTAQSNFSFVNQPNTTYAMKIAYFPPDPGMSANFMLVPLQAPSVDGTSAEPNWNYPNILCGIIQRNGTGSTLTLGAKVNQPTSNGSLYGTSTDWSVHPTFTTASQIEGNWSMKFTANNAITVTAPDGSSTNLIFPGVMDVDTNGLSSSEVAANFDFGLGMVAYFNSQNGGTATAARVVLGSATITQGATTLLTDNFATDTVLDTTSTWILASDGGATVGTYLLGHSILWFLDWPNTFPGYSVETNSSLTASGAWNTNSLTGKVTAGVYHANVDTTNLPPSGNVFFRLHKY